MSGSPTTEPQPAATAYEAAERAAFPGLPHGMTADEANRRTRAAVNAAWPFALAAAEARGWQKAVAALRADGVEPAARALHEHDRLEFIGEPVWERMSEDDRESYRSAVRSILTAAVDHLESTGGQP